MEGQMRIRDTERERMKEFARVAKGELKVVVVAEMLGMSKRPPTRICGT